MPGRCEGYGGKALLKRYSFNLYLINDRETAVQISLGSSSDKVGVSWAKPVSMTEIFNFSYLLLPFCSAWRGLVCESVILDLVILMQTGLGTGDDFLRTFPMQTSQFEQISVNGHRCPVLTFPYGCICMYLLGDLISMSLLHRPCVSG